MRPVFLVGLVILAVVCLLTCVGCNEVHKVHFQNLGAAQQEQMIEKGWIPAFTPDDARDINVQSDLDAASVYGSYISDNTVVLKRYCSNAEDSFQVSPSSPKWFRNGLQEANTVGKLKARGYEVLHCDEGGFNIAIFSPQRQVYYWSVRK